MACGPDQKSGSQSIEIPNVYVETSNPLLSKKAAILYLGHNLFSGFLIQKNTNDQVLSKTGYFEGKLQGEASQCYPDGTPKEVRFYDANKKVGEHLGFWPNGTKKFEYYFKADLHEGTLREWYANGQPFRQFHYKNGKENGSQKMWKEDGTIRANYVVKDGRRYGLIGLKNCKSISDEEDSFAALLY